MNGDDKQTEGSTNVAQDSGTERGTSGTVGGVGGVEGGTTRSRKRRSSNTGNTGNTGTGPGNDGDSTANTGTGSGPEQTEVPRIEVEAVEFGATTRRTRRSKPAEVSIKVDDLCELIAGSIYLIGQTREMHLRPAYDMIKPEYCVKIAEPMARILARLPERYLDIANNAIDPITMVLAIYTMYNAIHKAEVTLNDRYSAMVAATPDYGEAAQHNGTGETVGDEVPHFEADGRGGFGVDPAV